MSSSSLIDWKDLVIVEVAVAIAVVTIFEVVLLSFGRFVVVAVILSSTSDR